VKSIGYQYVLFGLYDVMGMGKILVVACYFFLAWPYPKFIGGKKANYMKKQKYPQQKPLTYMGYINE